MNKGRPSWKKIGEQFRLTQSFDLPVAYGNKLALLFALVSRVDVRMQMCQCGVPYLYRGIMHTIGSPFLSEK